MGNNLEINNLIKLRYRKKKQNFFFRRTIAKQNKTKLKYIKS